jgi:signal transduction histidine kinase
LSELVEQIYETYRPVAEDSNKQLIVNAQPGIRVEGDRELLAQMLINLIENAISHTGQGTRIVLSLTDNGPFTRLAVTDDGPGVPQAELRNIFKRFYRLEASRSSPGNGLGLSLVDAIANLHRFRLSASTDGPGLAISFEFKSLAGARLAPS